MKKTLSIFFKSSVLFLALLIASCSNEEKTKVLEDKLDKALVEIDSIKGDYEAQTILNKTKLKFTLDSLSKYNIEKDEWLVRQYEKLNKSVFLVYAQNDTSASQGTSFLVSADGICVSNFHVFENMTEGYVKNVKDDWFSIVEILEHDREADYVIFKIDLDYSIAEPLALSTLQTPKIGEKCFAIGNPKGLENTLSEGIISSIRDEGNTIQMTSEITHGSSGGPLFNKKGEVIGITSGGLGEANLNYAINIHVLQLQRFISSSTPFGSVYLVEAKRSYFHNDAGPDQKTSSYVVNGDLVSVEKKSSGYAYVKYQNTRTDVETRGWLSLNEITPVSRINNEAGKYFQVKDTRAYFHEKPDDSGLTTGYILKNEVIKVNAEKEGFVYLVYKNKQGNRTSGWINTSNLSEISSTERNEATTMVINTTEKEKIEIIKSRFKYINSIGNYEMVKRDLGTDPNEGAIVTGYFEGQSLAKLRVTFFTALDKNVVEYYFWEDELFFVFERDSWHNGPSEKENEKPAEVEENRYYLANGKLFRWLKNDKAPATAVELMNIEDEFKASNNELISNALEYL